jgi:alpha-D-xyloside xylohydrolase
MMFGIFLVTLAVLSRSFGSEISKVNGGSCALADSAKVDCGYAGIDQYGCESKGCCWSPAGQNSATPWCFFSGQTSKGYTLASITETAVGYTAILNLNGQGTTTYGADIQQLSLNVFFETEDSIRVKITDAKNSRWEIPESVISRYHSTQKPATTNIKFSYTESPFSFEITRVSDGTSLFKLGNSFAFKDQYIEIPTSIVSGAKTFGIGESTRLNHALKSKTYSLWAADIGALSFDRNLYGSYPYYLQLLPSGKAHGVMLMNSNGMDVVLSDTSVTFKTIGGIMDLYVFAGETPEQVVSQYTKIVGRPTMFPYWSYGFHNCKYGYTSVYQVEQVVQNYSKANIPLDTQWMDIDYMQNYRDFTYDATNFPLNEVKSFVNQLHTNGQHFIPIVDPGIMVYSGYEAYDRGVKEGLFIKDIQGNNYLGQVWPGPTYFPDFLNPGTQVSSLNFIYLFLFYFIFLIHKLYFCKHIFIELLD